MARKMKHVKRADYKVEVFRGSELLGWSVLDVNDNGMEMETNVSDGPIEALATYEVLLLTAHNICPFPSEKAWLERRIKEHARISPEAYVAAWDKRKPAQSDDESDIPF